MTLLSELRAAECVDDLLEVDISAVAGKSQSISLGVAKGTAIVAECNHAKPPLDQHGLVAWGKVYRLKLIGIEHAK